MGLGTLVLIYLRLGSKYFPLGVRLSLRWGSGWEVSVPYQPAFSAMVMLLYYSLGGRSITWTLQSVLAHLSFPITVVFAGFTPTIAAWMNHLEWIDIGESFLYLALFLYANTWFYRWTHTWPYEDGTIPDLSKWTTNMAVILALFGLFGFSLLHHSICKQLHKLYESQNSTDQSTPPAVASSTLSTFWTDQSTLSRLEC